MATTITASGNNRVAVDGLILPKIWITTLEQNPFPANGRIPASLVCWRGGNNLKIPIPDLIDTMVGGEAFESTFVRFSSADILDTELQNPNRPRILITKPRFKELKDGDKIRFRRERFGINPAITSQVFVIQEINDIDIPRNQNEVLELVLDKPLTTEDFEALHGSGMFRSAPIFEVQSIEADILSHRNKIHTLTY